MKETHALFGLPRKEATSPARQPTASQHLPPAVMQRSQSHAQNTSQNDEAVADLTNQHPPPRTVEYLNPSFSLERPVRKLEMDERLEVHNNFTATISNKMHKLDLVHRLITKRTNIAKITRPTALTTTRTASTTATA